MKKIISLLIALAMVLGIVALTACGDKETPTTPSTESASTTSSGKSESTTSSSKATEGTTSSSATVESTTASSDESTTASSGETTLSGKEKHPDFMDVNFGGRSFNFIVAQGTQQDWDIYEITAEATGNDNIVTEAIIERNRIVESLYNCKITSTGSATPEAVCGAEIQTGTSQYDFCMPMSWNAKANRCFYNIASMDIDLTHSWWDQNFIDGFGMTIDGTKRLYTLSGNFNLLNYDATWALFFNKDVYDKVIASGKSNINIYDEARKGTWTVDKMITLMDAAKSDTNGDSNMSFADGDVFGCVTIANYLMATALWKGMGVSAVIKDENDLPISVNSENSDAKYMSAAIDKAISLWHNEGFTALSQTDTQAALSNGQALFVSECLALAKRVTDEDARYSIVPFPKYDESQDSYHQYVCTVAYGLKVSAAAKNLKEAADFLEVFGYHSKMILYPQYINYFKTQCFCEDEAGEMLEIVLGTREFDLGIFGQYGLSGKLDSYIQSGKNMLSKALASTSKTQTSAIEAYIVSLKNLKH